MTDTLIDNDVELIMMMEFEPEVPCSVHPCATEAAWYLICPYDKAVETVCQAHRDWMLSWDEDEMITFDETCKHSPNIGDCGWEPFKK